MKIQLLILSALFIISGCSSMQSANQYQVQQSLSLKTDKGLANLFIHRESAATGVMLGHPYHVNGERAAILDSNDYMHAKLSSGVHSIKGERHSTIKLAVNEGDNLLIECSVDTVRAPRGATKVANGSGGGSCWLYKNSNQEIKRILTDSNLINAYKNVFYAIGYNQYNKAKQANTITAYNEFINTSPQSNYVSNAETQIIKLQQQDQKRQQDKWQTLSKQQKCQTRHKGWIYLDATCNKNKFSEGKGRAVYMDQMHSFNGIFKDGYFMTGKYLENGQLLFDGSFSNGQPDGAGICMYNNEPEECKYYQGKRVDALYKQRKQMVDMEKRQQLEMAKLRGEMKQLNNQKTYINPATGASTIGDRIIDSAIDKGMDKVFDHLF